MTGPDEAANRETWEELVRAGRSQPPAASVIQAALTAVRDAAGRERILPEPGSRPRRQWQPRWALAMVAAVAVVGVVAVTALNLLNSPSVGGPDRTLVQAPTPGNGADPQATEEAPASIVQGTGPVLGDNTASCAFDYNAATLGERSFAFDGVVIAIGSPGAAGFPLQDTVVTFAVTRWYRGGSEAEVRLDMWRPGDRGIGADSEYGVAYSIGTRMLVSGEPRWGGAPLDGAVAWSCGFTRYYDEPTAAFWASVFE